jgi:large subunit ribosomal protein L5
MQKSVLKEYYKETVVPSLKKDLGYSNIHQVPNITKITLNTGFNASIDKNGIAEALKDMSNIAGQQAVPTKARLSISNFKLREGMTIGAKVTLRGENMWNFLYRLIAVSLPNIRDFRGVPTRFDGNGNYTLGVKDHSIFPEINIESNSRGTIGMDLTIVTTAKTDEEGLALLKALGIPFRKHSSEQDS